MPQSIGIYLALALVSPITYGFLVFFFCGKIIVLLKYNHNCECLFLVKFLDLTTASWRESKVLKVGQLYLKKKKIGPGGP